MSDCLTQVKPLAGSLAGSVSLEGTKCWCCSHSKAPGSVWRASEALLTLVAHFVSLVHEFPKSDREGVLGTRQSPSAPALAPRVSAGHDAGVRGEAVGLGRAAETRLNRALVVPGEAWCGGSCGVAHGTSPNPPENAKRSPHHVHSNVLRNSTINSSA